MTTTNATTQPVSGLTSGRMDAAAVVCARALRMALLTTLVLTLILTLIGWVAAGQAAAFSALAAGGLIAFVFGPGLPLVAMVSRVSPAATLLVAMMTYVLQMVILVVLLQALRGSSWLHGGLDPTWLGATLMLVALGCTITLVVVALRARIPAFSNPSPTSDVTPVTGSAQTGTGSSA